MYSLSMDSLLFFVQIICLRQPYENQDPTRMMPLPHLEEFQSPGTSCTIVMIYPLDEGGDHEGEKSSSD